MPRTRVNVNRAAVRALLKGGGGVKELLDEKGARITTAAGAGFDMDTLVGRNRYRVDIATDTPKAIAMVAKDPTVLLRAIDAGR